MSNSIPGSGFLTSLVGSSAFQAASKQSELIQKIMPSIQPLLDNGATSRIRDITSSLGGVVGVFGQLKYDKPEVLINLQKQIDTVYNPISDITKQVTAISADWAAMGQSVQLLSSLPRIEPKTIEGISKVLELYGASVQRIASDIAPEELNEFCENEEITPETVAEAMDTIVAEATEEKLTIPEYLDKIKKKIDI